MSKLDITSHAMLVNLGLGVWSGFKLDRTASAGVATEAEAGDHEAFRVNKRLVAKEAIAKPEAKRNALRSHFLDRTLPWDDMGWRLLPRKMFQTYIDEESVLEHEFAASADVFAFEEYPKERDLARARLGKRFDASEYPSPSEIRAKFHCKVEIMPLPSSKDFRVSLSSDAIDTIRTQIEEATERRIMEAQKDVWARIEETVTHFAGRMAAQLEEPVKGKRRAPLHQSTINNLIHLVNAMPALNIVGDPNMKMLGRKLHSLLSQYNDAETMKGNTDMCAAAHDEVQDIIAEMSAFRKAFEVA